MIENHQYVVWWVSSVTGEHHETFNYPERAQARLGEVEQREYFVRGLVLDANEHRQSAQSFKDTHDEFTKTRLVG